MAPDQRRAVLVTGKALPVTALNDFGGQALQQGYSVTVFSCGPIKASSGLDRRIRVVPIKVRGRTRIGRKLRGLLSRVARRGDLRKRTMGLALLDASLAEAASNADVLVAIDPDAALAVWALSRMHRGPDAVLGAAELAYIARADREEELLRLEPAERRAWRQVESWQRELHMPASTTASLKRAHELAQSLIKSGYPALAVTVADDALALTTGQDLVLDLRHDRTLASLQAGECPDDLHDVVDAILTRSDEHWSAAVVDASVDRAQSAARRLGQALTLLFHRALHTGPDLSPLVPDPEPFLSRLRRSGLYSAMHTLERSAPQSDRSARTALLLTQSGSFFSDRVTDAARDAGVVMTEQHLDGIVPASALTISSLVAARALSLVGTARTTALPEQMKDADVWFVDWADVGAAWVSTVVPDGAGRPQVVVRLHSVEALSASIHVIDWSRVDLLIVVSPFLLSMVHDVVPSTRSVPSVVIPHGVKPTPARPKSESAWRTLGMVGWGQVVKDPLFTLDVLRELRRRQPQTDWQLRLVGAPMEATIRPWDERYSRELAAALADPSLAGAITLTGYTTDVESELAQIGFICSSSQRESFHLGLVEGALSGSVPVVRDWPVVAPWGGPRDLFPAEWVVQTAQDAAERVLSISDAAAVGQEASAWVAQAFGDGGDLRALGEALRGSPSTPS